MYDQLKLDNQLCFRLYTAARLTMQAYFPYFEPLGITYPQYLVMLVLWEQDKQPVNDIARRLHLETNTVTPLLQRMEKQGLLTRKRGKEDTRQRIVSLTAQGKALEEKAKNIPDCLVAQLAEKLPDVQALLAMIPELDTLIDGLSAKVNKTD
ncbi:MAG: MarR family transcriptional regulator [Paludibacteraceae bacterium]|nr:MarR family transcriptional regulator [Paludibacteraceae bacterium]